MHACAAASGKPGTGADALVGSGGLSGAGQSGGASGGSGESTATGRAMGALVLELGRRCATLLDLACAASAALHAADCYSLEMSTHSPLSQPSHHRCPAGGKSVEPTIEPESQEEMRQAGEAAQRRP